jgi:hypothetical protein
MKSPQFTAEDLHDEVYLQEISMTLFLLKTTMKAHSKILFLVAAILVFTEMQAQDNFYKFHALFLYNFTKHVQWSGAGDVFTIGVYGSDIAIKVLEENLRGRHVSGRNIEVRKVTGNADISDCQIVYAPKSSRSQIANIVEAAAGKNVLTVTEEDMLEIGACISFVVRGNRLNFRISRKNIENQGLRVSNALLSLGELAD